VSFESLVPQGSRGLVSYYIETTDNIVEQTSPYLMWKKAQDDEVLTGNNHFEGYCADLAEKLAELVKFDYTLKSVEDNKFGAKDNVTGSWNGMIGELVRMVTT